MCIQKEMKKLRLEDKKRKQREIKTLAKKKAADAETFENLQKLKNEEEKNRRKKGLKRKVKRQKRVLNPEEISCRKKISTVVGFVTKQQSVWGYESTL